MIRYLSREEKQHTRTMYEMNFPEDEKAFVDYYYEWKIRDNQILVMEDENEPGQLQVMIHLNPFEFYMCGEKVEVNYIVAVATEASVRKQGKMAQVMKVALQDMAKKHQPFTFLIPANPKVYLSSGFVFVPCERYEKEQNLLGERVKRKGLNIAIEPDMELSAASVTEQMTIRKCTLEDIPKLTRFSNEMLQQKYDIFPYKTEVYYARMLAELEGECGGLMLVVQGEELVGCFSYGQSNDKTEIQEILISSRNDKGIFDGIRETFSDRQINVTDMNYMIRILDIRVLGLLLRSVEPFSLKVQITDDIIEENNGCFEIKADMAGGSITSIAEKDVESCMNIPQLTEFLFGKMKLFIREWV